MVEVVCYLRVLFSREGDILVNESLVRVSLMISRCKGTPSTSRMNVKSSNKFRDAAKTHSSWDQELNWKYFTTPLIKGTQLVRPI